MFYINEAIRTESDSFYPVGIWVAEKIIANFIMAAEDLDQLKKAIFYGKNASLFNGCPPLNVDRHTERWIHGVIGIATEAGELMEALHAHLFCDSPIDEENLFEELGDLEWYEAILCHEFEFDPEQIRASNIAKLRKRYPEKFTEEAAINRDAAE
jgi:NTP pyrophosphatase (non-canonical NTP hydrolase)